MTPTTNAGAEHDTSITGLVGGIVHDAQELLKQQVELVKVEIRDDLRKTRDASLMMGAGIGLGSVAALLLTNMLVYLLHEVWQFPQWASYGIIGVLFALAGVGLVLFAKARFDSFNPLPDESAKALAENIQWIAKSATPK